jgi:hypothetical protein
MKDAKFTNTSALKNIEEMVSTRLKAAYTPKSQIFFFVNCK